MPGADAFALIDQIIIQLAIATGLAALGPSLLQQLCLAPAFLRPLAQRFLQPSIKPSRLDAQAPAYRPYQELTTMLCNKRLDFPGFG